MTDNTETRLPVALPWLAVLSAVVARELLPLAVMPSAALALLATLACSDALAPLVLVASLLADTTEVQLELLATRVRPMAATRATVVLKATVVLPVSAVVPDVPLASRAVL